MECRSFFFCVAHLSNEKTSMFTLKINGWNIIMEVWFRSFSPVKICRFHGHLPECRSYSGVSLCFTISGLYQDIPVVPGQAGGGSFQKEKNYIAQKEFAYRMCARRPTSAMPKSFLCCERAFCRSMVVMFCALK